MERDELEATIRSAFAGVRLGGGLSRLQLEAVDNYMRGVDGHAFAEMYRSDVIDDWTQIPEDDLHTDAVAHMDAESLRYYLPALMIWLLDHYEPGDMTTIGVLRAITPDDDWTRYRSPMFELFTREQLAAVAAFVETLPWLVALDPMDEYELELAFANYWRMRLPASC